MHVTVSFLGSLRDQVGRPSLEVELPAGSTYRDLQDLVAPMMEVKLAEWAWDRATRSFSPRVVVSLNASSDLRDEKTTLADGDEVLVVLPLAGG